MAKHAADNLPRSKGIKRRMEVSPLANDSRRVSRRLNPGDTSTAPRTRAAANAGASVQQPSTNAKSMHPIAAAPKPSAAQNRQTVLWSEQNRGKQIPHDQLVPRQTRLTSVAGRAETDAEAASRSGQKPMTGVTEAADATRHDAASDAATLKSRDASGKFLKGKPDGTNHRTAGAAGQGSLAPASGPDRSARNNRQGTLVPASGQCTLASASGQGTLASAVGQGRSAAKQAADKIAKRSALTSKVKSKVKSNRPSVQLAVAKPAAKTSPGKQAQQRHHAAASTRAVAARAVAANGPGVADRGANHAAGAAEKVPAAGVDAASLKALQQAAIAGKLGCPKCRYGNYIQPECITR